MRYLIADIARSGETGAVFRGSAPRLGTLDDAVGNTLVSGLDPSPLALDELPEGAPMGEFECGFRRVETEDPVLWTSANGALMKLNGIIIPLDPVGSETGTAYGASGLTMEVRPIEDAGFRGGAELIFALERGFTVGFRGFYECAG